MHAAVTPTASVLIIGNEILSGRTQDANLNYIARKLTSIGIRLCEVRVVADIESDILEAVNALRKKYDYLFTTGGIGPTHDDITADSVAKAFSLEIIEHPEARARLEKRHASNLNPSRLRMARMPKGAILIDNPVSVAPGFNVGNVYVLAGVPDIMQAMMDNVIATLRHGPEILSISVSGFVAESTVGDELGKIAQRFPMLDIGSYPWVRQGRFGTALVVRGTDKVAATKAADEIYALVAQHDPAPEREVIRPEA